METVVFIGAVGGKRLWRTGNSKGENSTDVIKNDAAVAGAADQIDRCDSCLHRENCKY